MILLYSAWCGDRARALELLPLVIYPDTSKLIDPQEWRIFTHYGWDDHHPGPGDADEERRHLATPNV